VAPVANHLDVLLALLVTIVVPKFQLAVVKRAAVAARLVWTALVAPVANHLDVLLAMLVITVALKLQLAAVRRPAANARPICTVMAAIVVKHLVVVNKKVICVALRFLLAVVSLNLAVV